MRSTENRRVPVENGARSEFFQEEMGAKKKNLTYNNTILIRFFFSYDNINRRLLNTLTLILDEIRITRIHCLNVDYFNAGGGEDDRLLCI